MPSLLGGVQSPTTGADIEIHESLDKDGKTANGYYDPATNTIHININAKRGTSGKQIALYTLGHETTHYIREWSPEKYDELASFVMDKLGGDTDSLVSSKADFLRTISDYQNKTDEEIMDLAREEVIADGMELILTDGKVLEELAHKDHSLWQTVKNWIKNTIAKIKKAYADLNQASKTAQTLRETLDTLEEVERLFTEGVREAGEKAGEESGTARESEGKFSIRTEYAQEIDDWKSDGMPEGEKFVLGMTGDVLQGLGAIESDIYINGDKIKKILNDHPEMTLEEIKRIPQILEDPVLILKSRNVGRNEKSNSRMVIFGTVKAENGQPIMSILDLHPTENNFAISDMQKVTSAYTKTTSPVQFVRESSVVYADKKRTASLLRTIGFQMPIELNKSGYIGSISYNRQHVNIFGEKFDEIFSEKEKKYSIDDTEAGSADGTDGGRAEATDREILAMALEGAVQTEQEYKIVKEYRDTAGLLEVAESKKKDASKRVRDLESQIRQLKNRIDTDGDPDGWIRKAYEQAISDKREAERIRDEQDRILDSSARELLRLRAAKPLREIVQREQRRANAAERREQKAKEQAEARVERAEKRFERKAEKVKSEYEQREKISSDTSEITLRVRSVRRILGQLNTMLYHPNRQKHVPEALRGLTEAVLKRAKIFLPPLDKSPVMGYNKLSIDYYTEKGWKYTMAKDKLVEQITSMDVDFTQWYTDVVKKAELADYSGVKGCMVIRPYGYAIWENIQKDLDARFKALGHENVCMPMFIPESLLQKEKDHVAGFAPECAVVTIGGQNTLAERLIVRPTSETLFCEHYKDIIHSYRDLPKLYNQWCNVVRWEKTTRPFLRTSEFLWQEGHTMHETEEEARAETIQMLKVYEDFYRDSLAIPAITGRKTEKEKFAGAVETYTIEPMMHNGVALQGGTSHYFGTGFAEAFDITFTDRENKVKHPHQTSWGVSTRMIGAIIMAHGDNNGLILPPRVAPIQVVIIPAAQHKEGVLENANALKNRLIAAGLRVKLDDSDNSAGWKFSQYEMKGVPVRLEIGPRDIANNSCVLVSRVTREKKFVSLDNIEAEVAAMLDQVHDELVARCERNLAEKTYVAHNHEEFLDIAASKPGYIKAMWCGETACEEQLKDETGGVKSRCIPFGEHEMPSDVCACCGKPAKHLVVWGRQY